LLNQRCELSLTGEKRSAAQPALCAVCAKAHGLVLPWGLLYSRVNGGLQSRSFYGPIG
jgi:hypothetical protein